MKTLIFGRSGQVASHLGDLLPDAEFWGRSQCDLRDVAAIPAAVRRLNPRVMVNAAAYTAVDQAESDPDTAWRINVDAVAAMARCAEQLNIPLIHISSDYVFDGAGDKPHETMDPTFPINVYGQSKLAGELAVTALCRRYRILRTSWVFSEYGANFVKTMLRVGAERETLSVVDDQIGIPTYAGDIAAFIVRTIESLAQESSMSDICHATGGRPVSWCGFAESIFSAAQRDGLLDHAVSVNPIPSSQYPTPAARPANSVLAVSTDIMENLQFQFDWEAGLERTLAKLSAN